MSTPAFDSNFMGIDVSLPAISLSKDKLAPLKSDPSKFVIDYPHYSCLLHAERRLAIVSASNIDGSTIDQVERKGDFSFDKRVKEEFQTGKSFFSGRNNIFDQGHLTKYEDVMWGASDENELARLGNGTFSFVNCAPQHYSFNRGMWSSLEKYILDSETDHLNLRVSVFTGPVLAQNDPILIDKIDGTDYKVPVLFWKVVIYKQNESLYAVGFLMSQKSLVTASGQVKRNRVLEAVGRVMQIFKDPAFMDYRHNATYQVSLAHIEELTGLKFDYRNLKQPFTDTRPMELVVEEVDVVRKSKKTTLTENVKKVLSKPKLRTKYIFTNMKLYK